MDESPTRRLIDLQVGGKLEQIVTDLRETGLSWYQVSITLRSDHDVRLHSETVRRWFDHIQRGDRAAS